MTEMAVAALAKPNPPLLRWPGSKRHLLPALGALYGMFPRTATYVEPFAGSACLFFAVRPERAVLGDFNGELIRMYRTVRDDPGAVAASLQSFGLSRDDYYRIRAWRADELDDISSAARFIYLNHRCFNGVYRTNRDNHFNVPMGTRLGKLPTEPMLRRASDSLRNTTLLAGDFESVTADVRRDDFVYLDPPYGSMTRSTYGEYGYGAFARQDVARLAECASRLDGVGATVVLSYAPAPELLRVIDQWTVFRLTFRPKIAGRGSGRRVASEVLAINRSLVPDDLLEEVFSGSNENVRFDEVSRH